MRSRNSSAVEDYHGVKTNDVSADESGSLILYMYLTLASAKVGTGIFLRFANDFQKNVLIHASPLYVSRSCFCFLSFLQKN